MRTVLLLLCLQAVVLAQPVPLAPLPAPSPMPDLRGLTAEEARHRLPQPARLVLVRSPRRGLVVDQAPGPGQPQGREAVLYVGATQAEPPAASAPAAPGRRVERRRLSFVWAILAGTVGLAALAALAGGALRRAPLESARVEFWR